MAAVQTFYLPHYPTYPIHVCMFENVSNAAYLRSQLLEANPAFDYAFLDATMILSPTHLLASTFLALHAHLTSRSKTRTPHSELVFRLHPNNNIGEAYRRFGLSDTTSRILAVKLPVPHPTSPTTILTAEEVARHLGEVVQGDSVDVGEEGEGVGRWRDLEKIAGVYKVGGRTGKKGGKNVTAVVNDDGKGEEGRTKEMEMVILGMMTIKGS